METLTIKTASKTYPLYIGKGIRFQIQSFIQALEREFSSVLIITDSIVEPLYLKEIESSLTDFSNVYSYVVPAGEEAKSFSVFYDILTFALEKELDRKALVIALGGGVVGDLAGFVAATYMRGIAFIQMPTTLLAHDSSVGGKVAINHPLGKNMIGAFYQPEAVVYDIEMLSTLPEEQWRSGFAEVIKHALIWDKPFYDWLQAEIHTLADLRDEKLQFALAKGITVKAEVVAEDEKESGIRSYLNFGHTLAHAIEAGLGYGKMSHGDAVAIGMLFAIRVSEEYYGIDLELQKFRKWFRQFHYPEIPKHLDAASLLQLMKKDKKAQSGTIRMVLMKQIGEVETVKVEDELILSILEKELEEVQQR
ncbi:3-dehydroquinate synthase [Calidifontibacillus erzurumensis]|uniref:3-dehydroquinate synthase n=1 Tax=Calidifontibacillus erzurumensis TaxID=2741433 RepID=A0A8J8GH40_9BACI|nr:3-dehydroquinate synthase [Calidifontibacillus erzurumensis]NSL52293.1 3-dehydroquinate synthase [Calidifontibacillus erzurumensis]